MNSAVFMQVKCFTNLSIFIRLIAFTKREQPMLMNAWKHFVGLQVVEVVELVLHRLQFSFHASSLF